MSEMARTVRGVLLGLSLFSLLVACGSNRTTPSASPLSPPSPALARSRRHLPHGLPRRLLPLLVSKLQGQDAPCRPR